MEERAGTSFRRRCVAISTRSSVREMIAPGAYAVLAPLMGGFLVGPRFLMGLLAGAITSGCMLAIMMANAGGAWDNSKKLCEKLGLKKSKDPAKKEQQKACVVGDTVGDPFKDTSGPALNILIKLMSMVSLTVAPLLKDHKDYDHWEYGLIPTAIFVVLTLILGPMMNILTWDDPLANMVSGDAPEDMGKGSSSRSYEPLGLPTTGAASEAAPEAREPRRPPSRVASVQNRQPPEHGLQGHRPAARRRRRRPPEPRHALRGGRPHGASLPAGRGRLDGRGGRVCCFP